MNQFVPDCTSTMGDAFAPLGGEDNGLMELLWCNGHLVMQSQAPRKPPPRSSDKEAAVQDNEAAAWFQYPAEEDALERDLFSELFGEAPSDTGRASKAEPRQEEEVKTAATTQSGRLMPPPPKTACVLEDVAAAKTDEGSAAAKTDAGGESSMLTIGSSFCGSNHVQTPTPRAAAAPPVRGDGTGSRDAATVTSSSMQQGRAKAGPPGAHRSSKRKQRDAAETEDVEFESAAVTCEPAQKATTAKRRRAAEVHNLSERRRRDRINEKMKALQELIPHCNKTDKASMLDEAIEYLKTLQLQLQVMWMGGGMAAGVHQYMQRVVGPPTMPPFMAPAAVQSPPVGHMPVADPYARCLAVDSLQPPPGPMHYLQGMSFYQQQQQSPAPQPVVPGGSLPASTTARTFPSDSTLNKKHENPSKTEVKGVSS